MEATYPIIGSELLSEALLDCIQEPLLVIDQKGKIVRASSYALSLLQYQRTEIEGRQIDLLFGSRGNDTINDHIKSQVASGFVHLTVKRKDKSIFPAVIIINQIVTASGTICLLQIKCKFENHSSVYSWQDSLLNLVQKFLGALKTPVAKANLILSLLHDGDVGELNSKQIEVVQSLMDTNETTVRMIEKIEKLLVTANKSDLPMSTEN